MHNVKNAPHLSVLVAEVDQAGHVEEKLNEVVQHQQDQPQTVQTEREARKIWYLFFRDRETPLTFFFFFKKSSVQTQAPQKLQTLILGFFFFPKVAALTSECRRQQCGPGTERRTQAGVEYPPKQ